MNSEGQFKEISWRSDKYRMRGQKAFAISDQVEGRTGILQLRESEESMLELGSRQNPRAVVARIRCVCQNAGVGKWCWPDLWKELGAGYEQGQSCHNVIGKGCME